MRQLSEFILIRDMAHELLCELENALEIAQMCEFYAAATLVVHYYGKASQFDDALDRFYSAYYQPEVIKYIDLGA